jgi:hypothetical protein
LVPLEVLATPRAEQQIGALTRRWRQAFDQFLDMLAAEGCAVLSYRLTGDPPIDHLCVKHLDRNLRVIVAFESDERAWIVLVGKHNESAGATNVYDELYGLLGVEAPDVRRTKPACCDEPDLLPPVLDSIIDSILDRADRVRRPRRRK